MSSRRPLDVLEIRDPCSLQWEQLEGGDRARFCPTCNKHVQNLSAMTRAEAETFLNSPEPLCVTYQRDIRSRVLTLDYNSTPRPKSRRGGIIMWVGIFAGVIQLLFGPRSPLIATRMMGGIPCRMPTTLPSTTQPAGAETSDDTATTDEQPAQDAHP